LFFQVSIVSYGVWLLSPLDPGRGGFFYTIKLSDKKALHCLLYENGKNEMNSVPAKQLYEQYGFLIFRTCMRILHSEDDAKDALQTVFLKLLEEYSFIRDQQRVVPWILKAAKNHCFNVLRYNKKFLQSADVEDIPCSADNGKGFEEREIIGLILKQHSKKVREAVYYTYIEQFDQREIQKLTGQSPATVRRNLLRFKRSLQSLKKRWALPYGKS
jgi:RNA polymerase sigma-70 factor (ECF subfamily)